MKQRLWLCGCCKVYVDPYYDQGIWDGIREYYICTKCLDVGIKLAKQQEALRDEANERIWEPNTQL